MPAVHLQGEVRMGRSNALKGALRSGLVFPGLGQLAQRRYGPAILFLLATIAGLAVLIMTLVQQALALLDQLTATGVPFDLRALVAAAIRAASTPLDPRAEAALWWVMGCWLAALVDAFLVGRKLDRRSGAGKPAPPP